MKIHRSKQECPHSISLLFVYHGTKEREAWWCSVCDKDLYDEAGRPKTLGEANAKDPVSETPSSGESTASRKLAPVTPSNELGKIAHILGYCQWTPQSEPCKHILSIDEDEEKELTDLLAWSDQRCIEARYKELADLNYWVAMQGLANQCPPILFKHIATRFAALTPKETK